MLNLIAEFMCYLALTDYMFVVYYDVTYDALYITFSYPTVSGLKTFKIYVVIKSDSTKSICGAISIQVKLYAYWLKFFILIYFFHD